LNKKGLVFSGLITLLLISVIFVFENFNGFILAIKLSQFAEIDLDLLIVAFLASFFSFFLIGSASRPYRNDRQVEVFLSIAVSALFIVFMVGFGFVLSTQWLFVLQTIPFQIAVQMGISWQLVLVGLLFGFLLAGSKLEKKDKSISPPISTPPTQNN